jgi:hypothetical protein
MHNLHSNGLGILLLIVLFVWILSSGKRQG